MRIYANIIAKTILDSNANAQATVSIASRCDHWICPVVYGSYQAEAVGRKGQLFCEWNYSLGMKIGIMDGATRWTVHAYLIGSEEPRGWPWVTPERQPSGLQNAGDTTSICSSDVKALATDEVALWFIVVRAICPGIRSLAHPLLSATSSLHPPRGA